jgi:hypothetical protein
VVLNKSKPIVYFELDHIGPRPPVEDGELNRGLWLRLVNNSVVPIEVQPMGTSTDPELTLLPDEIEGRWTRIEESDAPEPKMPMGLGHEVIVANARQVAPRRLTPYLGTPDSVLFAFRFRISA